MTVRSNAFLVNFLSLFARGSITTVCGGCCWRVADKSVVDTCRVTFPTLLVVEVFSFTGLSWFWCWCWCCWCWIDDNEEDEEEVDRPLSTLTAFTILLVNVVDDDDDDNDDDGGIGDELLESWI